MVTIEQLYAHSTILADAKDKASAYEKDYHVILSGLKSGLNEKRLASQFVARFCKFFPHLMQESLEAMFDLCEDSDINIRKQVIKDLPTMCRADLTNCQKVSDIIIQLLQSSDSLEISIVHMSLVSLLRLNAKGTLLGIFNQILTGEDIIRERAIFFLVNKIKVLQVEELLTKEVEEFLVEQCKKVLVDVNGIEFISLMKILYILPSMSTLQGRQHLLEIIISQANLGQPFDPTDIDATDCLLQCIKQASELFSKNVHSGAFVEHICLQVLPRIDELVCEGGGVEDVKLELYKLLADMMNTMGVIENYEACTVNVFQHLIKYMPLPPDESTDSNIFPNLQFSPVECLMYSFHHLAKKCPEVLTSPENADRLKDFRIRLQYFARGVQGYIKSLKSVKAEKTSDSEKSQDESVRQLAIRTTNNINTLIKDLFYNPPSYKSVIVLSFKIRPSPVAIEAPKRSNITPISIEDAKKNKYEKKIYEPPSGKYSNQGGNYRENPTGGNWQNRNRGRGGYRF